MFRKEPDFNRELLSQQHTFAAIDKPFLFSNEHISGYLNNLDMDLNGARVLSACGGGDHTFTFLGAGASQVDTFDINYTQKLIYELKNTMIRRLPYHEFMAFFYGKESFFNRKIINPIWNEFSDALKIYLEIFYSRGITHGRQMFIYGRALKNQGIPYTVDRQHYDSTKNKIPEKINFLHTDLETLPHKLSAKYDLVVLSNIFDYMYLDAPSIKIALDMFYQNILSPIAQNNLTNGGKIAFEYLWENRACNRKNFFDEWQKYQTEFNKTKSDQWQVMDTVVIPSQIENYCQPAMAHILTLTQKSK